MTTPTTQREADERALMSRAIDAAPEAPIGDMVFLPRAIVDSTLDALRKAQMFKVSTALSSAISPVAAPEAPALPAASEQEDA